MTINDFTPTTLFSTFIKLTLLPLLFISNLASASIIEHYAGIDISGVADSAYIDHNLGVYEVRLLDAATQTFTRDNQEGFSVKIERDFYNIESASHRGKTLLLGGDVNSNVATRFVNESARDTFAERVSEKTSFDTLTQVMLSGSQMASWIDLDLETETEQGRPNDEVFYNNLFDDDPYSQYSLDLSFDFTGNYSNDYSIINRVLYDSLYSFYLDSDVNAMLVAVEHDMMFTLDTQASPFYYGSVSRKLWFENESDALSAQAFFNADILDVYDSQGHSGWLQHNLLNNKFGQYSNSFNFSNVEFTVNKSINTEPVDVPEPATWLLFLCAFLLLMAGRLKSLKSCSRGNVAALNYA